MGILKYVLGSDKAFDGCTFSMLPKRLVAPNNKDCCMVMFYLNCRLTRIIAKAKSISAYKSKWYDRQMVSSNAGACNNKSLITHYFLISVIKVG